MPPESQQLANVIRLFKDCHFSTNQLIPDDKLLQIFNQKNQREFGKPFKRQLYEQLHEDCLQRYMGHISPLNIGNTIVQANMILKERIKLIEEHNGYIGDRKSLIAQKSREKDSLMNRSPSKTVKMQLQSLDEQIEELNGQIKEFQKSLSIFKEQSMILQSIFIDYQPKDQLDLSEEPKQSQISLSLSAYSAIICIFLEATLLCTIRPSFMVSMLYLHVIYLLFIGYFHRKAGMFLIIQNILTILCDLSYFLLKYMFEQLVTTNKVLHPVTKYVENGATVLIAEIILAVTIAMRILILVWMYKLRYNVYLNFYQTQNNQSKRLRKISLSKDIQRVITSEANTHDPHLDVPFEYHSKNTSTHIGPKFKFLGQIFYVNGKIFIRNQKLRLC